MLLSGTKSIPAGLPIKSVLGVTHFLDLTIVK